MLRPPSLVRALLVLSLVTAAACGGSDEHYPRDASADAPTGTDGESQSADSPIGAVDVSVPDKEITEAPAATDAPMAVDGASVDGAAIDGAPRAADADLVPVPTSIVVLPDTQYYSAGVHPEAFGEQTAWILQNRLALNIAAVLHVGDIVDGFDSAAQWTVATKAMHALDGVVPYVLVPGNHDTDPGRKTPINTYFSPTSMPWVTGTMVLGQIENNYALVTIGPQQWVVLGLEFGPRDSVVTWANAVLKAYPNNPAILLTHAYLYRDGTRYDNSLPKDKHQAFIPQDYGYTAVDGINDGEMLWQKLVLPNPNVRLVFCGHDTAGARLTSARPDGSRVHQMLSDYQWLDKQDFGFGYLRLLTFDYGNRTVSVRTYSPYLDSYLTGDDNQFTLDMNF